MIDPRYDFFPGDYPPDWDDRKEFVYNHNGKYCQVTGCLHVTDLDIHHIVPISIRPDHRTENLVPLCRFHHAMLPNHEGLEPPWNNNRYNLVKSYWRWNQNRTERIHVKAYVSRHEHGRVTSEDMKDLFHQFDQVYAVECKCHRDRDWKIKVCNDRVTVHCIGCWGDAWLYERSLREEIGVQLFQTTLFPRQNERSFPLPLDRLCVRRPVHAYVCEYCRALGRLSVMEKRTGSFGVFLGCEAWSTTGCQKKDTWRVGDEYRVWNHTPP